MGKATDLRRRVRSCFSGDERRKVSQLLRETESIDHVVCPGPLEAAVLEVRLIHRYVPPFNRRSKLWRRYAYLKLTLGERFPRLSVVRVARPGDGCLYLGPLPSTAAARLVAEAVESAVPIRRCAARPPKVPRDGPCTPAQLGVATCPCAGTVTADEYAALVGRVVEGLTTDPSVLLDPLCERMAALARGERFEEAAAVRDRAGALAQALDRQGILDRLRRAGRLELDVAEGPDGGAARRRLVLAGGCLVDGPEALPLPAGGDPDPDAPLPRHLVDELSCVASWLDAEAHRVRLVHCDGELASPLPAPAATLLGAKLRRGGRRSPPASSERR